MENGEWVMGNGRRKIKIMENEKWRMGNRN